MFTHEPDSSAQKRPEARYSCCQSILFPSCMRSHPDATGTEGLVSPDLQGLIDASANASILLDREGVILAINEVGSRHIGLDRENAVGKSLLALIPDDLSGSHRKLLLDVLHEGRPHTFEDERDGRYYRNSAVPTIAHDGRVTQVSLFSEDITEQRTTEHRLQQSEALYRFLAENTNDVVWQLDAQMRFAFISSADYRERGFSREETIGRSVAEVYTPEGKAILKAVIDERSAKQQRREPIPTTIRFEAPQMRKDGSVYWAETVSTRILDANGQICGFVGVTRNIEERRGYQNQLEEANQQLKARLAEISTLQEQLREKAMRDALTGLYNRHYLHETLVRELARTRRENASLAVIMVDLDHFKAINDSYGHAAGDQVIRMAAKILQHESRKCDLVCRYGGEEFLVVLPDITLDQAMLRAESWRKSISDQPLTSAPPQISASFGIAIFPEDAGNIETLLARADTALYESKRKGRNCISHLSPDRAPS